MYRLFVMTPPATQKKNAIDDSDEKDQAELLEFNYALNSS
jgi:hypothetical protein